MLCKAECLIWAHRCTGISTSNYPAQTLFVFSQLHFVTRATLGSWIFRQSRAGWTAKKTSPVVQMKTKTKQKKKWRISSRETCRGSSWANLALFHSGRKTKPPCSSCFNCLHRLWVCMSLGRWVLALKYPEGRWAERWCWLRTELCTMPNLQFWTFGPRKEYFQILVYSESLFSLCRLENWLKRWRDFYKQLRRVEIKMTVVG